MDWTDLIPIATGGAALITAIVALCTLIEMARQRRATYRPELIGVDSPVHGYRAKNSTSLIPYLWASSEQYPIPDEIEGRIDQYCIELHNIGMGPARDVRCSWDYDVSEYARSIRELAEVLKHEVDIQEHNGSWSIAYAGTSASLYSEHDVAERSVCTYLMPRSTSDLVATVPLPIGFVEIISILYVLEVLDDGQHSDLWEGSHGDLTLRVTYRDMEGHIYRRVFDVTMKIFASVLGEFPERNGEVQPEFSGKIKVSLR